MRNSTSSSFWGRPSLLAYNGLVRRLFWLAFCLLAAILFSDSVSAHGCADGETYIGTWTSIRQGGGSYQFSWRLRVPTGEGHAYEQDLVSREVLGGGSFGAWVTTNAPVKVPTPVYFLWAAQQVAGGDADDSCRIDCWLGTEDAFYDSAGGWSYEISLAWLKADSDSDGIPNLYDPDVQLSCTGDIFSKSGCTAFSEGSSGGGGGEAEAVEPIEFGSVIGSPYTTGDLSDYYGCGYATGGTTYSTSGMDANKMSALFLAEFTDGSRFGAPSDDKPYEGAYNMIRAGAGGGESAYFSACWGKSVQYIDYAGGPSGSWTATSWQTKFKYINTYRWHRYVLSNSQAYNGHNGTFYMQFWDGSCWRTFCVIPGSTGTVDTVSPPVNSNLLYRYVPRGYLPGDVLAETRSNVRSGYYSLPFSSGELDQGDLGGAILAGSGGGSGGTSLSASDLEQAFANALRSVGAGGSGGGSGGGISGDGADGDAVGAFGMAGVGDNGVSQGVEDGMGELESDTRGDFLDVLGIDSIDPASNVAAVVEISLPKPGGGAIDLVMSTLPDTSTAAGAALEAFRLILRSGILAFWSYRLVARVLYMYRELT